MSKMICSMCGKEFDGPHIDGLSATICPDCFHDLYDVYNEIKANEGIKSESKELSTLPKPTELKAYLDQYVIGQDHAKMVVCTAVYNHYKRIFQPDTCDDVDIEKANILLQATTGSGKCISGDTYITVRNKTTGEIKRLTVNEFMNQYCQE